MDEEDSIEVVVHLSIDEYDELETLAERDVRTPDLELKWLLRREFARRSGETIEIEAKRAHEIMDQVITIMAKQTLLEKSIERIEKAIAETETT